MYDEVMDTHSIAAPQLWQLLVSQLQPGTLQHHYATLAGMKQLYEYNKVEQ